MKKRQTDTQREEAGPRDSQHPHPVLLRGQEAQVSSTQGLLLNRDLEAPTSEWEHVKGRWAQTLPVPCLELTAYPWAWGFRLQPASVMAISRLL